MAGIQILVAVASALVTAVVTIFGTRIADTYIFGEQLTYEIGYSDPFLANDQGTQIVRILVRNDGRSKLDDVYLEIDPKGRTINQYHISAPTKDAVIVDGKEPIFQAHSAYLNPGEQFAIQFLFRTTTNV